MASCRGVVFAGDGTYEVREFPVPQPLPGGAVIAVEAVGLCASDVSQLHGHKHVPGEVCPVVPGHEIVGRVHALAPDADLGVAVGQRVGVDLLVPPSAARPQLDLYGYTLPPDFEHGLWGGYGEYMGILPGSHLVPLTDDVPAAELSLIEPLSSIVAWSEAVGLGERDRLVIQGPGHMGLIAAAYASSQLRVRQIVVTGTGKDGLRLEAARAVGAHATIDVDAEPDVVGAVRELTRGGPSVVMELSALATKPVADAIEMARTGGRILLGGLKDGRKASISSDEIVFKALRVVGGSGGTPPTFDRAGAVLNSGTFPTAALRGETYGLDEIDEAMAMLQRTVPGRDAVRVGIVHGAADARRRA
ncbi:MAG: zinc-binding dehydrogenase [Myxococcales bacterium]|nr:zinc-binding dehydrogenase [Myxococcales bacterium]